MLPLIQSLRGTLEEKLENVSCTSMYYTSHNWRYINTSLLLKEILVIVSVLAIKKLAYGIYGTAERMQVSQEGSVGIPGLVVAFQAHCSSLQQRNVVLLRRKHSAVPKAVGDGMLPQLLQAELGAPDGCWSQSPETTGWFLLFSTYPQSTGSSALVTVSFLHVWITLVSLCSNVRICVHLFHWWVTSS